MGLNCLKFPNKSVQFLIPQGGAGQRGWAAAEALGQGAYCQRVVLNIELNTY